MFPLVLIRWIHSSIQAFQLGDYFFIKRIAMCLRYPQASSVATLPTGSILPPPPPPSHMAVYYPQHGCILPSAPKTKKKNKKKHGWQISLTQLWVSISETCWHWLYQWNEQQWLSVKRGSSGVLVHWCHDWLIDYNDKNWFTGAVFDLLSEKPEQEQVSYNVLEWFPPHMNWM